MVRLSNPAVYLTLLITIIATVQAPVFAQSSTVANLENSSAVTAAKLVAEGLRIEEPATADSRRKAIEKYLQAIPLWQAAKDTAREARTLALIASAYITLGEKQNAFDFANRALPLSEKAIKECSERDRSAAVGVKAYVLDTIGRANQDFGDRKKARELYNEAISLSSSINDREGEASSVINLAKVSQLMGDYPKALEVAERAMVMVNELGDRRKQTVVLNNMCMTYQSTGAHQQAIEACNQALSISRDIQYRAGEASALNNLGNSYYSTGDYQKTIDLYVQAKEINKEIGNRRGEAMALNNIGWIYSTLGDAQKSIDSYNQALEIFRAQGDVARQAAVLNNLAVSYSDTGDWHKALVAHLKILPLRELSNNR